MQVLATDLRKDDIIDGGRIQLPIERVQVLNSQVYVRTVDNHHFEYATETMVHINRPVLMRNETAVEVARQIAAEFVDPASTAQLDRCSHR